MDHFLFISNSFDEDTKNWPFMQQPGPAASLLQHQEPQFFQPTMQQQQYTPQFPSSRDDLYGGLTSGLVDLHQQSYNQSSLFNQQPKFAVASGYHQQHNQLQGEAQQNEARNEVERSGFDRFLPSYGDYMFQKPTSGDVCTRVFGM